MDTKNDLLVDLTEIEEVHTRLGWISRRWLEVELEQFDLTVPQYIAMQCVRGHSRECSMSDLAEASFQVLPTMTGIIDRLVERGLVERRRSAVDKRSLTVAITPEGEARMDQIRAHKFKTISGFLSGLSPAEREMMVALTRRYVDYMVQMIKENHG